MGSLKPDVKVIIAVLVAMYGLAAIQALAPGLSPNGVAAKIGGAR